MDVTRATAATRVDENGLVNYAEVVGGDLVTRWRFSFNRYTSRERNRYILDNRNRMEYWKWSCEL